MSVALKWLYRVLNIQNTLYEIVKLIYKIFTENY